MTSAAARPINQRATLSNRRGRDRSWNGVTVRTVWWSALIQVEAIATRGRLPGARRPGLLPAPESSGWDDSDGPGSRRMQASDVPLARLLRIAASAGRSARQARAVAGRPEPAFEARGDDDERGRVRRRLVRGPGHPTRTEARIRPGTTATCASSPPRSRRLSSRTSAPPPGAPSRRRTRTRSATGTGCGCTTA